MLSVHPDPSSKAKSSWEPKGLENVTPLNPVGTPSSSRTVNIPEPAGIEPPVRENPNTVVLPVETVRPAVAASPPEAAKTVAPSTSNWKPPTSTFDVYPTSQLPSVFSDKFIVPSCA